MYLLFPISCLLLMTAVRYAISGRSQASPPMLHGRLLSSNSTVKVNESIAIGSCPQYILDDRQCALVVGDVDIYFWPDPSRDMSCLNIVGNATGPLMEGASTSTITFPNTEDDYTTVYWGCTARDSTSGDSYITTAVLATTGTISVKQYLYNPWSSQPCSAETLPSTSSISQPLEDRGPHASARVRRHALAVSSAITPNGGLLGATVTSGNFTLSVYSHILDARTGADSVSTSPSIYVNFHEVSMQEIFGGVVCASFPVSMLTFLPGELSTIEGAHLDSYFGAPGTTKPFNFNDLPCPPQSLMVGLTVALRP